MFSPQACYENAEKSVTALRAFLLGAGGFLAVTGSQRYGYPGAGPLACIVSSFVAGTGWKWRVKKQDQVEGPAISLDAGDGDEGQSREDPVVGVFEHIWFGLQPVLFASIGTEIKFQLLVDDDNNIITAALMVLVFGLIVSVRVPTTTKNPFSTVISFVQTIRNDRAQIRRTGYKCYTIITIVML